MRAKSIFIIITTLFFLAVIYFTQGMDKQTMASAALNQSKLTQKQTMPKKTGLILKKESAFEGYTLFAPITSTTTFLIDMEGRVINTWESDYEPGQAVYFLENGHLLRTAFVGPDANPTFHGGGAGGRVQEFTWDGKLFWDFEYNSDKYLLHHDIERLPNGNTLICSGENGILFEVTTDKNVVWKFVNPVFGEPRPPMGAPKPDKDKKGQEVKQPPKPRKQSGIPGIRGPEKYEPQNSIFKAHRYSPNYLGLKGKRLIPGKPLVQYVKKQIKR